jgi:excisionase family DNA binding protein
MSTGQASKLLSVTPDTILKWVKMGRLPALRTPGGHYRISEQDVQALLDASENADSGGRGLQAENGLLYCWEYFARDGRVKNGCFECLVYRAQALKCYEMNHLSKDLGYNGGLCSSSCDKCSYLRYQLGRPFRVLVITDDTSRKEALLKEEDQKRINLQFATCEYECSLLIERFRPDFVVVDCAMQKDKCRELCNHLADDPRLQGNTIILATPPRKLDLSYPGTVRIKHPFTLEDLLSHVKNNQICRSIRLEQGCAADEPKH